MASAVPARKSQKAPAAARSTRPAAMASRAPASTWESRNRADSGGPANPMTAKQSTGMVVTRPASPLERPSPAWSSSSTGPTLLTAVRRLSPVRTIATPISAAGRRVRGGGRLRCPASRHARTVPRTTRSIRGSARGTRCHNAFCSASVAVAATRMPATLMPSWVAARTNSSPPPSAIDSPMSAAAGTVVTEMNTPTSAPLFAEVSDRTPAIPAKTATTSDQRSGSVMNPVSGRSASSSEGSNQPSSRPASTARAVIAIAIAKPTHQGDRGAAGDGGTPVHDGDGQRGEGANSGPSTIAPMVRIAESLMIATAARSVAMVRKAR